MFNLVCLTWIFFRATSIHGAFVFLGGLTSLAWRAGILDAFKFLALFSMPDVPDGPANGENTDEEYVFQRASPLFRTALGVSALAAIAFFSANQANTFIYFQF